MRIELLALVLATVACSDYRYLGLESASESEVEDSGSDSEDTRSVPEEVCNGVDDDMDGLVDEGFPDADKDGLANCVDDCDVVEALPRKLATDPHCHASLAAPESLALEVVWEWTGHPDDPDSVYAHGAPIVLPLNDDNLDGFVDHDDVADVVVVTGPRLGFPGRVTALSGDGAGELWSIPLHVNSLLRPAGADLDGDGVPEIVLAGDGSLFGQAIVLGADGTELWRASFASSTSALEREEVAWSQYGAAAVADVDSDGAPDVVVGDAVFDASGRKRLDVDVAPLTIFEPSLVDLNGDGHLEMIVGNWVFADDGTVLFRGWLPSSTEGTRSSLVVDLDDDGSPEVVIGGTDAVTARHADGSLLWSLTDEQWEAAGSALFPAAAGTLFDDGQTGIVLRSLGNEIVVLTDDGRVHCVVPAPETELGTGGVGHPILYRPHPDTHSHIFVQTLADGAWVLDPQTCVVVQRVPDAGGAYSFHSSMVIADLSGDGQPEIVAPRSVPPGIGVDAGQGLVVLRPTEKWATPRRVWNQFAYHVTNISDDGSVPSPEREHWLSTNSWREQAWFAGWPQQSDLSVELVDACVPCSLERSVISVQLVNTGLAEAVARVGMTVTAIDGAGVRTSVGEVWLENELGAGESSGSFVFEVDAGAWRGGRLEFSVDPDQRRKECDEANNILTIEWPCDQ